jgi:four helix bundle protein
MTVRSYRDLIVWQKAMDLVVQCYNLTKNFPNSELYGLTSQLRRAAVSIPSNIAEGHGRSSTKAYVNHLMIAHGSLMELETQLILSARLDYCSTEESQATLKTTEEIGRMIQGLKRSLNSTDS